MNGTTSKSNSRNGRYKFTKSEKDIIIQYILDLHAQGLLPRMAGVEDMANFSLAK